MALSRLGTFSLLPENFPALPRLLSLSFPGRSDRERVRTRPECAAAAAALKIGHTRLRSGVDSTVEGKRGGKRVFVPISTEAQTLRHFPRRVFRGGEGRRRRRLASRTLAASHLSSRPASRHTNTHVHVQNSPELRVSASDNNIFLPRHSLELGVQLGGFGREVLVVRNADLKEERRTARSG